MLSRTRLSRVARIGRRLLGRSHEASTKDFGNLYVHERMLADQVRVNAYREAIVRNIRSDDVVLDLGTGTGILAMMAARRCRHVYAIDHSPFIEIAEEVASRNGCSNVTFVELHSKSFVPPEPVDVLLHEQIGDDLFEEDMVENLLDLKRRVLRPNGRILPGRFELYLDPVTVRDAHQIPFIWENPVADFDFSFLEGDPRLERFVHPGYHSTMTSGWAVDDLLAKPEPVLEVDLNSMHGSDEVPRRVEVRRPISRSGRMDGFLLSFSAIFDDQLRFDTLPSSERTHWMNRLYRTRQRDLRVGDVVETILRLDDLTSPSTWLTEPLDVRSNDGPPRVSRDPAVGLDET